MVNHDFNELNLVLAKKRQIWDDVKSETSQNDTNIHRDFDALHYLITQKQDKKSVIKQALTKALVSEFHFEITPKHAPSKSIISIEEPLYDSSFEGV